MTTRDPLVTSRRNAQIEVKVASGFEEMLQAIAIRSAVYVGEKGWPFREEWDGNDFTATHILAKVNGDAAGTMRVRYFGDFVKIERLAILSHYRQRRYGARGVAWALGEFALDFCRRKGFTRFYGHALEELVPFWNKLSGGFLQPMDGEDPFDCSGKKVVPMFGIAAPYPDAIDHESGHMVIVRPEGEWDKPGYWESSVVAAE